MAIVDPTQYVLIPFKLYGNLDEKLQALLDGETLFIKRFEKQEGSDVLVRLEQKKYAVTQISYDLTFNDSDPRYWVTFNLGINDLSLFSCFKFEDEVFNRTHLFMINDIVNYMSVDGRRDTAIIEEVYHHVSDPDKFAYRLSRDTEQLYAEDELSQHRYM